MLDEHRRPCTGGGKGDSFDHGPSRCCELLVDMLERQHGSKFSVGTRVHKCICEFFILGFPKWSGKLSCQIDFDLMTINLTKVDEPKQGWTPRAIKI